jgi:hypothetical protein
MSFTAHVAAQKLVPTLQRLVNLAFVSLLVACGPAAEHGSNSASVTDSPTPSAREPSAQTDASPDEAMPTAGEKTVPDGAVTSGELAPSTAQPRTEPELSSEERERRVERTMVLDPTAPTVPQSESSPGLPPTPVEETPRPRCPEGADDCVD